MAWLETQALFADALIDPDLAPPAALRTTEGVSVARRFAVYRNNVIVSLVDALAARFPVTQRLVGEEFFRAMARVHVRASPPTSPVMLLYGEDFPPFIEAFPPAARVPYLADVARLEAAHSRANHAADERPLGAADFAAFGTRSLLSLRLRAHASVEVVHSRFAVHSIWSAHVASSDLSAINPFEPEVALVARPRSDVLVVRLRSGEVAFLNALFAGISLGDAASAASREAPDFDLASALTTVVANEIVVGFGATEERA